MPFSASTCLTYTGNTPLGATLYFYSDFDSFTSSFGSVATNLIIGGNCPYIITGIPDGATIIRLRDYTSGCCVDIPIQSSNLCLICDLNFNLLSASTVSQIVVGDLISSCEANVTDYVVNWYGPNSTTNVGYVSGKGTQFTYQFTHPLTGTSAIFAQAGTYIPIVDRIISNGVYYSQTGGTGFNIANTSCFPSIDVSALKCNNGNTEGDYSHTYQFSNAGLGVTPQPLSATFELSANTKFFAFEYQGYSIYDLLDITLFSSNYSQPIKLESIYVGGTNPFSYSSSSFPRSYPYNNLYKKVLTLSGFNISNGDYLSISITPNTTNAQTNWFYGCNCFQNFECDSCIIYDFKDNPYPIVLSAITSTSGNCSIGNISITLSGCNTSNSDSDFIKYVGQPTSFPYITNDGLYLGNYFGFLKWSGITCTAGGSWYGPTCRTPNSNVITYEKSIVGGVGQITITCSSYSDFELFYNEYYLYYGLYSGSPTNPLSFDYYRALTLFVPTPLTNNCGDGTNFNAFPIHYSSVVTFGGSGPWYINFTMPTITKQISFTNCELYCNTGVDYLVNTINNSSTGSSNNFSATTYSGSKYIANTQFQPFYFNLSINNNPFTALTLTNASYIYDYNFKTIPWSGGGNNYIFNLSGQTCYLPSYLTGNTDAFGDYKLKFYYYYEVRLSNPNDVRDFDIYGSRITNGIYSGWPGTAIFELALRYSGGTVTYSDPYYTI